MRIFLLGVFTPLVSVWPTWADSCTSNANLVANCGFESGDFTDWSLSGPQSGPSYLGVSHGVDAGDAHSGSYGAYLGGFGSFLYLSQNLLTVPGQTYAISFWVAQSPATPEPYFSSLIWTFGSTTSQTTPNLALPFTQVQFNAVATSTVTSLLFGARDDTGFFSLDDVLVTPTTATPEPGGFALLGIIIILILKQRFRVLPPLQKFASQEPR